MFHGAAWQFVNFRRRVAATNKSEARSNRRVTNLSHWREKVRLRIVRPRWKLVTDAEREERHRARDSQKIRLEFGRGGVQFADRRYRGLYAVSRIS